MTGCLSHHSSAHHGLFRKQQAHTVPLLLPDPKPLGYAALFASLRCLTFAAIVGLLLSGIRLAYASLLRHTKQLHVSRGSSFGFYFLEQLSGFFNIVVMVLEFSVWP